MCGPGQTEAVTQAPPRKHQYGNRGEAAWRTNPRLADTDGDGLPDGWEVMNTLNPLDAAGEHGAAGNPDGDHFPNSEEYARHTNPRIANYALWAPLIWR